MEPQPADPVVPPADPDVWVDQHGDYLYRYALARVRETAVAEDLVQETFLAALRGLAGFGGRSTERTWLTSILKRKIIDFFRRKGRERATQEMPIEGNAAKPDFDDAGWWQNLPASWGNNPGAALEEREFLEAFQNCLGKMPNRLAAAFTLREMEGLSTEELTQQMETTPGNMGVLLHRARLALRRCLEVNWFHAKTDEV